MTLLNLLNSEAGLTLVGGALGAIWTAFRSRDWYQQLRRRRYYKAVRALEAAVEDVYRTYVRAIKQGRSDGKLTDDEAARARRLAKEKALAYGRSDGIDVLTELGEDYLDLWISKVVRRARRR